jgi:hypothetical protein
VTRLPHHALRMTLSSSDTSTRVQAGVVTRMLRVVIVLGVLAVLIQAVLAGQILSGDSGALLVHGIVAQVVVVLSLVQVVLALIAWRRKSASGRLAVVCAVVLVAVVAQLVAGASATLTVHIPLGVALFGGYVWLLREVGRA